LSLAWTNNTPGFTLSYDVQRSNTSGSGYASIGTPSPDTTTTLSDSPSPVTTARYYVVDAKHSTWSSAHSNEQASNGCIGALNLVAGTTTGFSGDNAAATSAQLAAPSGVAVDSSGNVYIADTTNNRIRKVAAGTGIITTYAGGGASTACTFSGTATSVSLNAPRGVAVDSSGNVYIADTGNNCVRKVVSGTVSQVAGGGASTACSFAGAATAISMLSPRGIAVDSSGNVYIADSSRNCIRKVTSGNISLFAGSGATATCSFSGTAASVSLSLPSAVAVDSSGTVYIADTTNNCIRKVASGTVSQVAGGGATTTCSFAGTASTVSLSAPTGVAIDSSGRVVVADSGRRCVRLVSGTSIGLLAGTGTSGSTGDNGPAIAALLITPAGVAANSSGDVWIVDSGTHRVRRVEGPT
jgi:sugar lactone lactonase YvrE